MDSRMFELPPDGKAVRFYRDFGGNVTKDEFRSRLYAIELKYNVLFVTPSSPDDAIGMTDMYPFECLRELVEIWEGYREGSE